MKVTGLNGKGVGKLGLEVFSINHGVQIRRGYNGEVSNPSTDAQVGQRSRFKLASQLSAVMAPVLAFTRKGLQSPRNIFTKVNMPYFYGDSDGAQVTYENLQIAPGSVQLPSIAVQRQDTGILTVSLKSSVSSYVDKLVFCLFKKLDTGDLQYVASEVHDVVTGLIDAWGLPYITKFRPSAHDTVVMFCYGIRFNNDRARGKYDNYHIESAVDFARLVAFRTLSESDVTFTQTRGVTLYAQDSATVQPTDEQTMLFVTANGLGQVGVKIGQSEEIMTESQGFAINKGTTVVLRQKAYSQGNKPYPFLGWFNNGDQTPFSQEASITLTINTQRDIIARWQNYTGLE